MKIQILDAETFSYDNKTVVLRCKGCGLLFGFWATKEVGTVDMLRECPRLWPIQGSRRRNRGTKIKPPAFRLGATGLAQLATFLSCASSASLSGYEFQAVHLPLLRAKAIALGSADLWPT